MYAACVGIDGVSENQKASPSYNDALSVSFALWLSTTILYYGVIQKSYKWILAFICMFWAHELIIFILRFTTLSSKSFGEEIRSIKFNFYLIGKCLVCFLDFMAFLDLLKFARRLYVESYRPDAYSRRKKRDY